MLFDDNAPRQTINVTARNQRGFLHSAEDYKEEVDSCSEPLLDHDYYELHFATRRERSRLRRNMRVVTLRSRLR